MSSKRISPDEAQLRAQSKARLTAQRRAETETVLETLRAEQIVAREKTAKLKALRIAKETADAETAAAKRAVLPVPRR